MQILHVAINANRKHRQYRLVGHQITSCELLLYCYSLSMEKITLSRSMEKITLSRTHRYSWEGVYCPKLGAGTSIVMMKLGSTL